MPMRYLLKRHRERDKSEEDVWVVEREEKQLKTLREKVRKIKRWLDDNDDKPGKGGKPRKSNITDNESAKMKSAHGVIQDYDGVAMVDAKHQVIVHAEAYGEAQEPGSGKCSILPFRSYFLPIRKPNGGRLYCLTVF